jgi:hypothetical protein
MRKCFYLGVASACVLYPIRAMAQTGDQTYGYFEAGRSYIILGGRDERAGGILGAQIVRDDPRFKWWGPTVRPVENIYLMNHFGHDSKFGSTDATAIGITYGLRMLLAPQSRLFLQYDFGPQFDTRRSHSLPSEFNVTPWLTLGTLIPGRRPIEAGFSFMHISNVYTQRPNFGQDFIMAFIGFKL